MAILKMRKNLAELIEKHNYLTSQHEELAHKFYGLIRSIRLVANGTTMEEHFNRRSSQVSPGNWNNNDAEYISALTKFAKFCKEDEDAK